MPSNVTDVDAFTATVVVPNDTEAATQASLLLAVQPLANRTRNSKNRLDVAEPLITAAQAAVDVLEPFLQASISGNTKLDGDYYTIAAPTYNVGGFVVASDEITMPAIGKYLVIVTAEIFPSNADLRIGLAVHRNGTEVVRLCGSSPGTAVIAITAIGIVDITNTGTDKLKVASECTGTEFGTIALDAEASHIVIRRLS